MALDQAYSKKIQDHVHGVSSLTMPSTLKTRVITSTTPSTPTANGSEVATSGGYTAGGAASPFSAATTATPSVSANSGSVSWTNFPAVTAGGIEIWESTPVRIEFGTLTGGNKVIASGDTVTFSAGAIASSLQ